MKGYRPSLYIPQKSFRFATMSLSCILTGIQQCSQFLRLPYSITYAFTDGKAKMFVFFNTWEIGFLAKCALSQVSRSSGSPCCAQNKVKTAKAFTSVSLLKRPMLRPE